MVGTIQALALAALVFIVSHSLPTTPSIRERLVRSLGEQGYLGLYTLISALSLSWLAWGYASAPLVPVWAGKSALAWLPILVMPFASVLLVAGYTTPNPTMIGRMPLAQALNPAPGILSITRHPIFWAIALWGFSHIPPTGDLASLIFFGSIGAYSLFGMWRIDQRKQESMGAEWGPFAMRSSLLPFLAIIEARTRPDWRGIGLRRLLGGLALYAALFAAHPWIAGAPVLVG